MYVVFVFVLLISYKETIIRDHQAHTLCIICMYVCASAACCSVLNTCTIIINIIINAVNIVAINTCNDRIK